MNQSAAIHAEIESRTKEKAERVLQKMGITPAEAIRLFYAQICLRGDLPFPALVPNELTRETLNRSKAGEGIQHFDSLDDMFKSWEE